MGKVADSSFRKGLYRFLKYVDREKRRLEKIKRHNLRVGGTPVSGVSSKIWDTLFSGISPFGAHGMIWIQKKCEEHAKYSSKLVSEMTSFSMAYRIAKYQTDLVTEFREIHIMLRDVEHHLIGASKLRPGMGFATKQIDSALEQAIKIYDAAFKRLESIYQQAEKRAA